MIKEKLTKLYEQKDMQSFVRQLEGVSAPKEAERVFTEWANETFGANESAWDDFFELLTDDQYKRIITLGSSERQKEYLLNKAEQMELTDEEFSDLKAADF